ncbi:hypothetical protein DL89DRAFT_255318 [Linderina pennispora]|uniref:Uncharacterized protein n=1 Tax=Linderina pennispora TaxID=61395 RepID=A0A1Y1WI06_9FUNG|nr:uncharacterized protein DL89DRAFT_255318 [Linderina pennispora]ORX73201.1 hypothetical protein DL89DRAFT_255318 [Linderina pennispora]
MATLHPLASSVSANPVLLSVISLTTDSSFAFSSGLGPPDRVYEGAKILTDALKMVFPNVGGVFLKYHIDGKLVLVGDTLRTSLHRHIESTPAAGLAQQSQLQGLHLSDDSNRRSSLEMVHRYAETIENVKLRKIALVLETRDGSPAIFRNLDSFHTAHRHRHFRIDSPSLSGSSDIVVFPVLRKLVCKINRPSHDDVVFCGNSRILEHVDVETDPTLAHIFDYIELMRLARLTFSAEHNVEQDKFRASMISSHGLGCYSATACCENTHRVLLGNSVCLHAKQ